jgi:hypothetical protein
MARPREIDQAAVEKLVASLTPGRLGTNAHARFMRQLEDYLAIKYWRVFASLLKQNA